MYQTITRSMFRDAFVHAGRERQFSYAALDALFDYYEEEDPDMELDVIAICCDWTEYDSVDEACHAHCIDVTDSDDETEALEQLRNNHLAIDVVDISYGDDEKTITHSYLVSNN